MKSIQLKLLFVFSLLFAIGTFNPISAQISDDIGTISPAISTSAVFYTSVYVSDTDENGSSDMLIGLAQGDPTAYGSFSCIVRFVSGNSVVEAHNGSAYAYDAANPVPITFDSKYEVWFEIVDITDPNGQWNPWVKGPGMESPVKILDATANFRAKGITQLDTWKAVHQNAGDDGLDVLTIGQVAAVGDIPTSYNEASIASVTFNPAGLNESWDPDVTSYTASFPFGTSSVSVSAEGVQHGTSVSGIGTLDVTSGNGQLSLIATSESGTATKSYTVDWAVNDPQKDATLSDLTVDVGDSINFAGLSPLFVSTVKDYSISVPFGTKTVVVNATASASTQGATVTGVGSIDVSSGAATTAIVVTSADQSNTQTYNLNIIVDDFELNAIYIEHVNYLGDTATTYYGLFEPGVNTYTKVLPRGVVSVVNMEVGTNDANSTYELSSDFELVEGVLTTNFRVFSADKTIDLIYEIDFVVEQGAAGTKVGHFEPTLAGSHVIYSKISLPAGGNPADGLFAISDNYMSDYPQFSAGFRFVNGLPIQLHDGVYTSSGAGDTVEYDVVYHCWLSLDLPNQTYGVYVQKEGDANYYVVGENAVFRNSLSNTATRWGAYRNGASAYFALDVMKVEQVSNVGDIPSRGSDATLSAIKLNNGMLNEVFNPATLTYTATVPFGVNNVDVSAIATDPAAFIIGDSTVVLDITGAASTTLKVTSDDNSQTSAYVVTFGQLSEETDATLKSLSFSEGTVSPAFNALVTEYVLDVPFGTTSLDISAEVNVDGGTIVGGGIIQVGSTSSVEEIVVTAKDGSTTKTYSITISPAGASNNANLLQLGASIGSFDKPFNQAELTYVLSIPFGSTSVRVTPVTIDQNATVVGGGVIDMTGKTTETVTIVVTAADGVATKTYTVNITVLPASSVSSLSAIALSAGSLSPAFAPTTLAYTVDVAYGTNSVTVDATSTFAGLTVVSGDGVIDVSSGTGTATIVVTAEDLSTTTYVVVITVLPGSTDANLKSLLVEGGILEPLFDPSIFEYVAVVPLGTTSTTIVATLNDTKAKLTGAGAVDVISGSGVATIVVVSEDGSVTQTYKVSVYVGSKPDPEPELSIENELFGSLSIFPNPVTDYLKIDLDDKILANASISLMDINGRVLIMQKINGGSAVLDLSTFAKGLYLINIQSEGNSITRKLIK